MSEHNHIENDQFEFFVPIQKAENIGVTKDTKRWIEGIASTEDVDLQGEIVVQSGIDLTYFIKYGYYDDNHKDPKIGEPTEARITRGGLFTKGFLYRGLAEADKWWNMLNALEQSDASRKIGFSIAGKILRRAGKSILRCFLTTIAITDCPVNTSTFVDIVKALSKERHCSHPWRATERACKGCPGNVNCPSSVEVEEKALSAGGMGGRPLRVQSLEGSAKVQTYKSLPDQLNLTDAVNYLRTEKGYSVATAKAIADAIFIHKGL